MSAAMIPARQRIINTLVVDDDEAVARDAAEKLRRLGHEVVVCPGPVAGLKLAREGRFDLVICDLLMPELDGYEFLSAVHEARPDLPVVLMSGNAEIDDVINAYRRGAVDFLLKPLSRLQLGELLDRLFRRRAAAVSNTTLPAPCRPAASPATQPAPSAEPAVETIDATNRHRQLLYFLRTHEVKLPVPPKTVRRITALADAQDIDAEAVFQVIESDPTLARAVLRLALSPSFRGHKTPGSVREAVARVGARRALANAAATVHHANYRFENPALGALATELWLSHYVTSVVAGELAAHLRMSSPSRVQTGALFMQVGELAILHVAAEIWPETLTDGRPSAELCAVVRRDQGQAGAFLLRRWKLPAAYAELALHHCSDAPNPAIEPPLRAELAVARLARHTVTKLLRHNPFGYESHQHPEDRALLDSVNDAHIAEAARTAVTRAREVLSKED